MLNELSAEEIARIIFEDVEDIIKADAAPDKAKEKKTREYVVDILELLMLAFLAGLEPVISGTLPTAASELFNPDNVTGKGTEADPLAFKPDAVNSFHDNFKNLGPEVSAKVTAAAEKAIAESYKFFAGAAAAVLNEKPVLTEIDAAAIKFLQEFESHWVSDSYARFFQPKLEVAMLRSLKSGMSLADAQAEFEASFKEIMSMPGYWHLLASNTVYSARSAASIMQWHELGMKEYMLVATIDESTTNICLELDQTTFKVSDAYDHVQNLLAANTPEEAISLQPWVRSAKSGSGHTYYTEDASGSRNSLDLGDDQAMIDRGVMIPPFHANCRTELVLVSEEVQSYQSGSKHWSLKLFKWFRGNRD